MSNKKIYPSKDVAEHALIEARTQFEYPYGKGPVAVYLCDDCGNYHLTSQGEMSENLKMHMKDGKINRQKEANQWLQKLKRK